MFEGATAEQAHAVLAAAHHVVQAMPDDTDSRSGRGEGVVVAAGRLLFTPAIDVAPATLPRIEPQELSRAGGADR